MEQNIAARYLNRLQATPWTSDVLLKGPKIVMVTQLDPDAVNSIVSPVLDVLMSGSQPV